jgi:hypothetical protein
MYFSANSSVINGKPSWPAAFQAPGDLGTLNYICRDPVNSALPGNYAERIWLTWHYGDGVSPSGWNAYDSVGAITPPMLLLNVGGAGEGALIGDPAVAYWRGKWHMFYEGTDQCDGNNARIFHATSDNWHGPFQKQGQVSGLTGNTSGSGLAWPTIFIEDDQLYLYYSDGNVTLLAAKANDSTGQYFTPMNGGSPVFAGLAARGHVLKIGPNNYQLVADTFQFSYIQAVTSSNKFGFPSATPIIWPGMGGTDNESVGLPVVVADGCSVRIYYTGIGSTRPGAIYVYKTVRCN